MTEPKWKKFEKAIHQLHFEFGKDTVTLDVNLMGHDSKTLRQVDVVIRGVVNQYRILVIVECKDEARPVDLGTIEGFVSKIKDVRANKGVMVSTSGFTSAAIELARAHCIDTRTYVDTENIEWKTEMSIPFLLTYSKIERIGIQFSSVPFRPMCIPTNILPPLIETASLDGAPTGPVMVLLGKKWNHDPSLHTPGDRTFVLAEDVLLQSPAAGWTHAKVTINLQVREHHYLGPLPVSMVGFRDEQDGSLITRKLTTGAIEPAKIMSGELPDWKEIVLDKDTQVECYLRVGAAECLPETIEEFQSARAAKKNG
jgi:hypothetical protein